ncbi:MAG: leucine-rich repeat domain-containing protein [Ruminococcus sp.]|nr:leucine-rich repeat domain-containing protein [Ruminococcus sp.]
MIYDEIFAKIEDIQKELQELKDMVEIASQAGELLPVKAQTTPERPPVEIVEEQAEIIDIPSEEYDPNEFDIEAGVLVEYTGNSEEVTIPYGVTKIGQLAFWYNQTIKKVNFPDTVTEIENQVFFRCKNLVEVNNSKNVTKIGEFAFCHCCKLEKIDIDNIIEIADRAFYHCESLQRLRFSKNIKTIGESAFYGCENLNISIPKTCEIGEDAFEGCKSVVIREVVKK